jgi:siroheme synthase
MGVAHLLEIKSQLLAHGMAGDTPVAVIQSGTTSEQIVVIGALENILEEARDILPPATIVIGQVVNLRQQIAWFNESQKAIPFGFS